MRGTSGSVKSTRIAAPVCLMGPIEAKVSGLGESLWKKSNGRIEQFASRSLLNSFPGLQPEFPAPTQLSRLSVLSSCGMWGNGKSATSWTRPTAALEALD